MSKKLFGETWQILSSLNEGGQAWTYLAENITINDGRRYVLKRLKNKKRLDRFETEIRAVQVLNHPNIVRILDHDILDDDPYFVMEYCEFGELEQTRLSAYPTVRKLEMFQTICSAVGHAHENGVVHRDIKPANVLFRSTNEPVISDFGICFVTEEGLERMTETVEQMGPRFYMSPELADGKLDKITTASDVYSLGKLLYWLLAGRVMNRENFSDAEWDLRDSSSPDHLLYLIYDLLKKSITEKPSDRFVDANELAVEVGKTIATIENRGHFLQNDLQHRCLFCGIGRYKVTDAPYEVQGQLNYDNARYLGITPLDHQTGASNRNALRLRILECEWCGNIQLFRTNDKKWKS